MPAAVPRSSRPLSVIAPSPRVVALAGGTGAAKFLRGLIRVLEPARITVIVNTADDVERHGLLVSPDIDSVVHVNPNGSPVHPGQLVNVKVIDYQAYDLVAEVPKKKARSLKVVTA